MKNVFQIINKNNTRIYIKPKKTHENIRRGIAELCLFNVEGI